MATQRGGDVGDASGPEQIERGIATGSEVGGGAIGADLASLLAQRDIADVVQDVLDLPVATPELFQPRRIRLLGRQTSQRIRLLAAGVPSALPADILDLAVDAADLRETWARAFQPVIVPASPSS